MYIYICVYRLLNQSEIMSRYRYKCVCMCMCVCVCVRERENFVCVSFSRPFSASPLDSPARTEYRNSFQRM